MTYDLLFFSNSILLGVGLAMDAFSVSMANGLNEPKMGKFKMTGIAGTFGFFQALMPMVGWFLITFAAEKFSALERFIPWIALFLLLFIGGKMLIEGIRKKGEAEAAGGVGFWSLIVQGIATSIDALSVGFTIAEYSFMPALLSSLIIAAVTFVICIAGLIIGKKFGTWLSNKAQILGGAILIIIGIEIFIKGII